LIGTVSAVLRGDEAKDDLLQEGLEPIIVGIGGEVDLLLRDVLRYDKRT
jgi:hypothetical protein